LDSDLPAKSSAGPKEICHVPVAGDDHGFARLSNRWGCFLPDNILSIRLYVQAAEVSFHNEDFLLQREFERRDLLGYFEGAVEPSTDDLPGSVL